SHLYFLYISPFQFHLHISFSYFTLNDTSTTVTYSLSLHDALPISNPREQGVIDGLEELWVFLNPVMHRLFDGGNDLFSSPLIGTERTMTVPYRFVEIWHLEIPRQSDRWNTERE